MSVLINLNQTEIPLNEVEVTLEHLESRLMIDILQKVITLSKTNSNVVISGEAGTGKEWIAKLICQLDCENYNYLAHLSFDHLKLEDLQENVFQEMALELNKDSEPNKIALIIDNFSDLEPIGQLNLISKLIKFRDQSDIESVRFIFIVQKEWLKGASNNLVWPYICELLNPVSILIPPLREHREDIIPLVGLFIAQHQKSFDFNETGEAIQISDQALYKCINYEWPGNLRQLKNAITHACYSKKGEIIQPEDLPISIDVSHLYTDQNVAFRNLSFQNAERQLIKRKSHKKGNFVVDNIHKIIGYLTN